MLDLVATPAAPPVVLLVDDDADTRHMYARFLTDAGMHVEEARDGREALDRATHLVPTVVVTDIMMPGMDGLALCREIKHDARLTQVPVIAVTGCPSPHVVEEAQRVGVYALLAKPCEPDRLLDQVRQTVAHTVVLAAAARELCAEAVRLCRETREARTSLRDARNRSSSPRRRS